MPEQGEEDRESIELIVEKLSELNLHETTLEMEAVVEQMRILQEQIVTMREQLSLLDNTPKIEEYQEVKVNVHDVKDVSLDMFKTLPEFNGDRDKYPAWRNSAMNVMKIFENHKDKPKYFEALNIVRNKIIGAASESLTNYNTVFNFDAIISRLDFTYADKRPIYIIEQEMIVLQQRNSTIEDFYDSVNKKLNALINKINMTHKEKPVARAMVQEASAKALRTFVTGLRGDLGRILYASNPSTLPEAYAKIQTIINDQERIRFANQYNQPKFGKHEPTQLNPNFKPKSKTPIQIPQNKNDKPEPMDVDRSSMNVNVGSPKRQWSGTHSNQRNNRKFQRVNQAEVIENEVDHVDSAENDEANPTEGELNEIDDETTSIFLDN